MKQDDKNTQVSNVIAWICEKCGNPCMVEADLCDVTDTLCCGQCEHDTKQDAIDPALMTEEKARCILGDCAGENGGIYKNNCLCYPTSRYKGFIHITSYLTADDLEALAWWMRNKTPVTHDDLWAFSSLSRKG